MLKINGGKAIDLNMLNHRLPGFKHALVSTLCSTVLFPEVTFHFKNIPKISDTFVLVDILKFLGADCTLTDHELVIHTANLSSKPIPIELSRRVHGALYLFPVMLARFDEARIGETGGCAIGDVHNLGSRPFSHILEVLNKFGFDFKANSQELVGTRKLTLDQHIQIDIQNFSINNSSLTGPFISGATKTALLMAGLLKPGNSLIIMNPYTKPDVTELLRLYQLLEFDSQFDSNKILLKRDKPIRQQVEFNLLGDLSVLMTYITLAVLFKQNLRILYERIAEYQTALAHEFDLLLQMGIKIIQYEDSLEVIPPRKLNAVNIEVLSTSIYSDHQPFFALMLLRADNHSTIQEFVWESRFDYAKELTKLGYQLEIDKNSLKIYTNDYDSSVKLKSQLHASDLRAAAVLLIAACHAKGEHYLTGYEHLQRGYEHLIDDLIGMGADIERV